MSDYENALLISVNGERSSDGKNWYYVTDWTKEESKVFSSLPQPIQEGFNALVKKGTVGTVGTFASGADKSGQPIKLYLINIAAIGTTSGGADTPISEFEDDTLTDQTILLRGEDKNSNAFYCQITQDGWSKHTCSPTDKQNGCREALDDLISNKNLAINVKPKIPDPPGPPGTPDTPDTSITCYVLNLASFADPAGR